MKTLPRRRFIAQAGALGATPWLAAPAVGQAAAPGAAAAAPYEWRSLPFGGGGFVPGLLFHPRQRGLLYARTDIGGAYRFNPATQAWVPLLDHLSRADADLMGVLSLAVDAQDPRRLYAACGLYIGQWSRKGALLASSDFGASWQVHELGFGLGGNMPGRGTGERLQVDPHQGQVLWLGSTRDGLWRSEDQGRRFSRVGAFVPQHVSLVLCDARSGGAGQAARSVYVGSHDQPGLWVSHDGGRSFAREAGTPAQVPQRAAFAADGTLVVSFALGEGGVGGGSGDAVNPGQARSGSVWKRSPQGRWTDISPLPAKGFGYAGLDVALDLPGRIVVSTIERWGEGDEVFLSDDGGARWTALSTRSQHDAKAQPWLASYHRGPARMGHWMASLQFDPFDSRRAVYGTGYGLWLTENLGAAADSSAVRWRFAVDNLEETAVLGLHSPSGGATLLAAMGDVAGAAWDDTTRGPSAGLFAPCNESNRSVDAAWLAPAVVARTSDGAATGGYVSTNGGVNWRPFGGPPRQARGDAGRVAVSAGGGFLLWAPPRQPAMFSRDRGRSWALCEGWPTQAERTLEPVAERSVEGIFYVFEPAQGQLLQSTDGGATFRTAITGLPKLESWQEAQLVCAPGQLRDLWLALPQGLLHLPGPEQPARMMPGVLEAWRVALGKAAEAAPYHSLVLWGRVQQGDKVSEGLFRSDDAGASLQRICDDSHRYGRLSALAADPLEHGTVYLAPHGRGVIVGRPRGRA